MENKEKWERKVSGGRNIGGQYQRRAGRSPQVKQGDNKNENLGQRPRNLRRQSWVVACASRGWKDLSKTLSLLVVF